MEAALKPAFVEVSNLAATALCEDMDSLYWEALSNKSKLTTRVDALGKQQVDEIIPPAIMKWQTNMIEGNNTVYNFSIVEHGQRILKQITEEWEEILRENKGISIIQNIETQNTIDLHTFVNEKSLRLDSDVDVSTESFQAVGLYIAGYLANGILVGLSHPILGIILLVAAQLMQDKVREQLQGKIQTAINDSLLTAAKGDEIQRTMKTALSFFRFSIKSQIEAGTINRIHEKLGRRNRKPAELQHD